MKKIGIVGGIGWRSTVEYYEELCRRSEDWNRSRSGPGAPLTPEIAIESLDLTRAIALLGRAGDDASWAGFEMYHRQALQRLEASGAEVAVIASNTPHQRFEAITRGIRIPVISIFDATAQAAARVGIKKVLVLGTQSTMASAEIRQAFVQRGIAAAGPADEASRLAVVQIIDELQRGRVDGIAARLDALIHDEVRHGDLGHEPVDPTQRGSFDEVQFAACLACTELPLAFPESSRLVTFDLGEIRYINTTAAHIDAVFVYAVAGEASATDGS